MISMKTDVKGEKKHLNPAVATCQASAPRSFIFFLVTCKMILLIVGHVIGVIPVPGLFLAIVRRNGDWERLLLCP